MKRGHPEPVNVKKLSCVTMPADCRRRHRRRSIPATILPTVVGAALCGCLAPQPPAKLERRGDEIVACGQFFHIGAPVVLWLDPGGYDAYRIECRFTPDQMLPVDAPEGASLARYGTFRRHLPEEDAAIVRSRGWDLDLLAKHVDLFVLHYDVCGSARRCFKVLHDIRGLSVHFLLDVDGTIYQTLDLKERAWHAGPANDRSIGIEIANMGAYEDRAKLDDWYMPDPQGRIHFVPPLTDGSTGIRTTGFIARPARNEPILGTIHGRTLWQYDLTDAQYESLIKLTAALGRILPRIRMDVPRAHDRSVRSHALSPDELARYSGLIGHYHLTKEKIDPGPALDWHRLLAGIAARP